MLRRPNMLIDTHCHIHDKDYPIEAAEVFDKAATNLVEKYICVGTSQGDSILAVDFATKHVNSFAAIGVHPHDTKDGWKKIENLLEDRSLKMEDVEEQAANSQIPNSNSKIVAVGEIGLDYYYDNSPRETQVKALKAQIELAQAHSLPIIFHVRDAFDDFWPIFDSYEGIRGVIHSFTDNRHNLDEALKRGLFIGVNGISTFTKDLAQIDTYKSIPLDRLLFETDAPLLTPAPFRGKVNEPAFVKNIAEFHAKLRGITLEEISIATSANAHALFAI